MSGVFSWIIVPMVSDRREPFDSEIGFYVGQLFMSCMVIFFSIKTRLLRMTFWCVLWLYLSQVLYTAFVAGTAWLSLAIFSVLLLNIFPLLTGLIATLLAKWWHRHKAFHT